MGEKSKIKKADLLQVEWVGRIPASPDHKSGEPIESLAPMKTLKIRQSR